MESIDCAGGSMELRLRVLLVLVLVCPPSLLADESEPDELDGGGTSGSCATAEASADGAAVGEASGDGGAEQAAADACCVTSGGSAPWRTSTCKTLPHTSTTPCGAPTSSHSAGADASTLQRRTPSWTMVSRKVIPPVALDPSPPRAASITSSSAPSRDPACTSKRGRHSGSFPTMRPPKKARAKSPPATKPRGSCIAVSGSAHWTADELLELEHLAGQTKPMATVRVVPRVFPVTSTTSISM
mmetsp:Transcript_11109/g.29501  ORF Transcript_11109/g.29501 Transcript_11109/m.29501 type:complete len:243 (+) Transcript_11109:388-1116(+)